jgi:hypothetical protein
VRMRLLGSGLVCGAGRRLSRGFGRFRGCFVRSLGGNGWRLLVFRWICQLAVLSLLAWNHFNADGTIERREDVQGGSSAKTVEVL